MDSLEEKVSVFMCEEFSNESDCNRSLEEYEFEDGSDYGDSTKRNSYWESQETLLQEILERYNSTGSKLREEVGRIIEEAKASEFCSCIEPKYSSDCSNCLRRQVVALLCGRGFKATLCLSQWKHTKKFPGGSHEYIALMASSFTREKQIPFLIELELKEQFQIAKASKKYQKLIWWLPEFYIGKPEYLTAIVRVLCDAAKKSMKEKKIHMGPWRKTSFMQMKWSSGLTQKLSNVDEPVDILASCLRVSAAPA
ncbi:hypothetical protein L6164_023808 [Bauhinia variegata]|uniref:Uncharacterized protein n=1 Tax=Bauhinia variegata TaxID=167791 RepID=A0ACB9MJW8_BAUVA|nr:hypothetical protein L6164_023808 [Bauhinia variegata]